MWTTDSRWKRTEPMGDEREGLRPEHFDCGRADCAEQKIMFQERVGQLTQELQAAKELLESCSSEHMRRVTELEAVEEAAQNYCDEIRSQSPYDTTRRGFDHLWAVLSTNKEET